MNSIPQQKLCEIISKYGQSICDDADRFEGLLRDLCRGEHRRDIFVLMSALKEQIPSQLLSSKNSVARELLLRRLAKQLHDDLALSQEKAQWAIISWALALGVISNADAKQLLTKSSQSQTHVQQAPPDSSPSTATSKAPPQSPEIDHGNPNWVFYQSTVTSKAPPQSPPADQTQKTVQSNQAKSAQLHTQLPPLQGKSIFADFRKNVIVIIRSIVIGQVALTGLVMGISLLISPFIDSDSRPAGPTPTQFNSSSITERQAINLVNRWIVAMEDIFAPPFDRQLAAELTTGALYWNITKPGGGMDQIQSNGMYFEYDNQKVLRAKISHADKQLATIEVTVTVDSEESEGQTEEQVYTLEKVNGQWKIANIQKL
jgi:hypothetical protein